MDDLTIVPDHRVLAEQRKSFAYGSLSVQDDTITRASIADVGFHLNVGSSLRFSVTTNAELKSQAEENADKFNAIMGLLRQFDGIVDLAGKLINKENNKKIDLDLILHLHRLAMEGVNVDAGRIRNSNMRISGSLHNPPPPEQIRKELDQVCHHINSQWISSDAFYLAAYALWQINRIHPFVDGNGRTARALSYLLLAVKLNGMPPGAPTIPEQIAQEREAYFDALQKADRCYDDLGIIDVSALAHLIYKMLERQLSEEPALSDYTKARIDEIVEKRFFDADDKFRLFVSNADNPTVSLWSINDHLILHITSGNEIEATKIRRGTNGALFPGLLASDDGFAEETVDYGRRNAYFADRHFKLDGKSAFYLKRDASIVCRSLVFSGRDEAETFSSWQLHGTIYVVRYGFFTTDRNVYKAFDSLLARDVTKFSF